MVFLPTQAAPCAARPDGVLPVPKVITFCTLDLAPLPGLHVQTVSELGHAHCAWRSDCPAEKTEFRLRVESY